MPSINKFCRLRKTKRTATAMTQMKSMQKSQIWRIKTTLIRTKTVKIIPLNMNKWTLPPFDLNAREGEYKKVTEV